MEEVIWLELDGGQRDRVLRQRIDGDAFTIGRGWDNDVVVDDPHVAAHHLRLVREADGRWLAHDLGSRNGLQIEGRRGSHAQAAVAAGTVLRIGRTRLRLHRGGDPVAPEQALARGGSPWPAALAASVLVLLLSTLEMHLAETGEPKFVRYLTALLALAAVVVLWTSAWAVISRIFHGHASFGRHLRIAAGGLLAYSVVDMLGGYGAFALSSPALARFVYVAAWLLLGATCLAHLRALGPARARLKMAAVAALAALGIGTQTLKLADARAGDGQPVVLQRLAPPWLRLAGAQAPGAFFDGAAALRAELDKARSDAPAAEDAGDGGD